MSQQVGRVGHPGDHLVAGVGQDPLDACPQQRGVLGDHDAHGSTAVTIVGPVAGLDTVNVPRAARTRSSRPRRPVASSSAVTSAPPTPSSNTETCNASGRFVEAHGDHRLAWPAHVWRRWSAPRRRRSTRPTRLRREVVAAGRRSTSSARRRFRCAARPTTARRPGRGRPGSSARCRARRCAVRRARSWRRRAPRAISFLACGQVGVELGLGQPDRHRQRHQPGLHAVVQVALDAVAFGLRRGHRALAGVGERAHLVLQRGGRRRRQQPAVDRGVERRREDHDRDGGGERDDAPAATPAAAR